MQALRKQGAQDQDLSPASMFLQAHWSQQALLAAQCQAQAQWEAHFQSLVAAQLALFPPALPPAGLPPLDPAGLPSTGSALHALGKCRPCAWFWKPKGCTNGQECAHCHLCPDRELKERKRANGQVMRLWSGQGLGAVH